MGRVVAPCKLGIKPRARVNSFSRARVKGTAEVKPNKLYCTVPILPYANKKGRGVDGAETVGNGSYRRFY